MVMGRRRVRRARKPKAMRRRRGFKSSGSKGINKVYRYVGTLQDQYIVSDQAGNVGQIEVLGGSAPVVKTALVGQSGGTSSPVASATGVPNSYDFGVGIPFKLSNLALYTGLTSLYDSYRIREVQCTIEFMSGDARSGSYQVNPTVYAVVDQDDAGVPLSQNAVTARQGHRVFSFNNKSRTNYTIKIKPNPAIAVYQQTNDTGLALGFQHGSSMSWQDSQASALNEYYGLKLWFADVCLGGTNANISCFRLKWRYVLEFKTPLLIC